MLLGKRISFIAASMMVFRALRLFNKKKNRKEEENCSILDFYDFWRELMILFKIIFEDIPIDPFSLSTLLQNERYV